MPTNPARRFNLEKYNFQVLTGRLTHDSTSRYIGVSPAYLKLLIDRGQAPPFHQVGKLRIFKKEDLDRWIQARRVEPQPGPPIQIRKAS